jgi:hypothetical protein
VTREETLVFITEAANGGPPAAGCELTLRYDDLSAESLRRLGATTVVCHLFGTRLDAMTVLRQLATIGYTGRCLVLSPKLPRRDLVLKELQAEVSGIQIELIEVDLDPRFA